MVLYIVTILTILGVYAWVHVMASFTLPVPWTDEAHFLWQSIAIQQNNTLAAPELNPDRILYGEPPAFMILSGLFFKVMGFSLFTARSISLVFVAVTFFLLGITWLQFKYSFFLLLLSGLFLLNRYFIVLGNVARPEALLLCLVVLAMVFLLRGQIMKSLAVVILSPLVHPNGIYFLIAVVMYLTFNYTEIWKSFRWSRFDIVLLSITGLFWICYVGFIVVGWDGFLIDMQYQFTRKFVRNIGHTFISQINVAFIICLITSLAISIRKNLKPLSILLTFSFSSWLVNKIGQEMWYGVFDAVAFLLLSVSVFELAMQFLPKTSAKRLAVGAVFLVVVSLNYAGGMVENIAGYPSNIVWSGMGMSDSIPYVTSDDLEAIRGFILSHSSDHAQMHIEFEPGGDGLLFYDLRGKNIQIYYAHKATQIVPDRKPDLYIIHESKHMPPWWREYPLNWAFTRAGIDKNDPKFILRRRQNSEVWYYRFTNPSPIY